MLHDIVPIGTSLELQVAIFVVLAMVLRQKPDVLISNIETWVDDYIGDDKVPLRVWVISQVRVNWCKQLSFFFFPFMLQLIDLVFFSRAGLCRRSSCRDVFMGA